MKTYLVTSHYHVMNVDNMRAFTEPEPAWEYWDSLGPNSSAKRIYEMSDKDPPRLLKEKDRNEGKQR